MTQYAGMIGEEFRSKVDQLSKILGSVHEASVGTYKESLLRSCLQQFLPKRYSVGTGFVAFVAESSRAQAAGDNADLLNLKEYHVSSQLDIIVFDDVDYAPIFRNQDFVVVRPESVRAIIEVKGFLKNDDVKSCVEKFIEFGKSLVAYKRYRGDPIVELPALLLIAWNVYVDKEGNPKCNGGMLRKAIVKTYRQNLTHKELDPDSFPLLSAAYIYDDCVVNLTRVVGDGIDCFAYSTDRGKHVRYGDDNQPVLDRDLTIASLLATIYVHLAVPFNPDFAYYDQSITPSVHPHQFAGQTDLLTGKAV